MLPLSNLSSVSNHPLSAVLNKDKSNGISTLGNCIYACSGDEYRQCRRIRNTAIANQQKQNSNDNSSRQDINSSLNETPNNRPRRTILNLWHAVRVLQLNIRQRRKTGQYVRQINSPESDERRTTTSAAELRTIDEDENENTYRRANIEIAEPVLNELPVTVPLVPQPTFISLTSTDQEDEQDTTPVTGQTLRKIFFFCKILFLYSYSFHQYILQQNYLSMKMLFVFLSVKMPI
jgi:hypothetical protein